MNIFGELKTWLSKKEKTVSGIPAEGKLETEEKHELTFDDIAAEMRENERHREKAKEQDDLISKDEEESFPSESQGISYIRRFIEQASGYENCVNSRGIPYTRKTSHGNCANLLWVCNDCGFTSKFSVRNDMTCCDDIFYCKRCRATQCLTTYYNGHKSVSCCICNSADELVRWDGEVCPKCGGHIVQFNGIVDKPEFRYAYFNLLDKGMTMEEWLKSKGL